MPHVLRSTVLALALAAMPSIADAQVTQADYVRAAGLSSTYSSLVPGIPGAPGWLDDGRFWYRTTVKGGHAFILVDPSAPRKVPAFDHPRLAAALSRAMKRAIAPEALPFSTFTFEADDAYRDAAVDGAVDGGDVWPELDADYRGVGQGLSHVAHARR